jgi:protease-4
MRVLFSILSILLLAGCAFVKVNVVGEPGELKEQVVEGKGQAKIAVVDISGIISLTPFGLERFSKGPPLVPRLKEELERIRKDAKVVGVVVRIDSPGGSVTASVVLEVGRDHLAVGRQSLPAGAITCPVVHALGQGK